MKRRQVLALLGSAAVGGCVGRESGAPTTATTAAQRTTETQTIPRDETEAMTTPEPPEVGVADPEGCPSFDSDVKRVVCSPDADAPLAFDHAERSGSLPRAEFSFELTNETNATFETNFYGWSVWKRVDRKWFRVAPREWPQPLMYLRPGDSHAWQLTVDNSDLDRPIPRAEGTEAVTVVGLGSGTYAFGVDGWFEGQDYRNKTSVAARFELSGNPLELTPVGIERVERDGETVAVYASDGRGDPAAYTVTRVDDPPKAPRRMIPEQVLREAPLRNALAHFEPDVRRVRLVARTGTVPPFGVNETRYVEYEGEAFTIEVESLDSTTTGE